MQGRIDLAPFKKGWRVCEAIQSLCQGGIHAHTAHPNRLKGKMGDQLVTQCSEDRQNHQNPTWLKKPRPQHTQQQSIRKLETKLGCNPMCAEVAINNLFTTFYTNDTLTSTTGCPNDRQPCPIWQQSFSNLQRKRKLLICWDLGWDGHVQIRGN